jgi:hypothetical protein
MLLNIILMIVFVKLFLEILWVKEGMDLELPTLNIKDCDYDVNIIFPFYDVANKIYTNQNNFIHSSYQNIKTYAGTPCEPKK